MRKLAAGSFQRETPLSSRLRSASLAYLVADARLLASSRRHSRGSRDVPREIAVLLLGLPPGLGLLLASLHDALAPLHLCRLLLVSLLLPPLLGRSLGAHVELLTARVAVDRLLRKAREFGFLLRIGPCCRFGFLERPLPLLLLAQLSGCSKSTSPWRLDLLCDDLGRLVCRNLVRKLFWRGRVACVDLGPIGLLSRLKLADLGFDGYIAR